MTALLRCTILMGATLAVGANIPRPTPASSPSQSFATTATDIPNSTSALPQQAPAASSAPSQSQQPAGLGAAAEARDAATLASDKGADGIAGNLSEPIKPEMKVQIIRYIDGEFGRATKSLPGKTNGFTIRVGNPINDQAYQDALRLQGTAIGAGDPVQVTRVDFEAKKIVLQLNGGAKKKFHLMDHIQIGLGGDPDPGGVAPPPDDDSRRAEGIGAVIVLDYGKPLPDVSPNDIKAELAPFIDFSKGHSAAENWVETLSPEFQDAVRDHKALPGMDQQTVIAAIGHPDRKVRETNPDGIETESWVYGNPPAKTIFVTFIAEKVTKVEECGGPQSDSANAPTCAIVR